MKRQRLGKASKRLSCSKKYRIEKNVRAHNKKVKRDAKKNPGKYKKSKKDPGVPNAAPFKEKILREAQQRKEREEEEKKRQKEKRLNEVNKRRSLEGLQKDALQRQKEFEQKSITLNKMKESAPTKTNETSRKAYYKEFKKVVESSDVVIEVLDARDPLGCRCLEVEKTILESGPNKRIVLLLNKIDLVPKENVEAWLKYLRSQFPTVAFKASTQAQNVNLTQCKVPLKTMNSQLLSTTSQCVGADSLLKLLSNYCRHNEVETSIRVGVVGFPNVGKSSVINSLKRARACNVGAVPGVTKSMQEVSLNKNINILDCPGIVMVTGTSDAAVILRNCVKIESIDDPVTPVAAILKRCNKNQMMMRYNITDYKDEMEFLQLLAKKQGKLLKGGVPNVDFAAKSVLHDWNSGRISYYTHPPLQDNAAAQVEAKIVNKMADEFDWSALEEDNLRALNEVAAPSSSHSILYQSSGVTTASMETEDKKEDEEIGDVDVNDDGEEWEDMEMDKPTNFELGEITVKVDSKKKKAKKPEKKVPSVKENIEDVVTEGSNIQANKKLKEIMKNNKKKRKRADKISDKLGDSLLSAMNFNLNSNSMEAEEYDFNTDLNLPS
ncbi:guanine nucleotide-binding protein-like 3 homolog [Ciona intestinalis]